MDSTRAFVRLGINGHIYDNPWACMGPVGTLKHKWGLLGTRGHWWAPVVARGHVRGHQRVPMGNHRYLWAPGIGEYPRAPVRDREHPRAPVGNRGHP